jgi:hypothetical protein
LKPQVPRSGTVVADRYRLEEPLGHGGMGTVWRAEHLRLRLPVAVKFLDPAIADDPEMLDRFMREAEAGAAVRGTHVVQMLDCGVDAGAPYIAMELLNGESLEARLRRRKTITPAELNKVFREVADAVGHAHDVGVIHRDLKPGNIFIARTGQHEITKVLDFGIAKVLHPALAEGHEARTRTGTLLGTPHYMSPEQARGIRNLDQRSDLWSLAVIAFECLTGERPFPGDAVGDVVVRICTAPPPMPSAIAEVPAGFDAWFIEGVSKDPNQRFSSACKMADSLEAILVRPTAPSATRPGGFRGETELDSATLASNSGSGPASQTASPHSATLDLRRATNTVTALLGATAAGLVRPISSRQRWLFGATALSLVSAVVIALWPHPEISTPTSGARARYEADIAHLTPAEPDAPPSRARAAEASVPAEPSPPVPPVAASEAVAAAESAQVSPVHAPQQRSSGRAKEKQPRRQPRATQTRKPGSSKKFPSAPGSFQPEPASTSPEPGASSIGAHPPKTNDPFAERR